MNTCAVAAAQIKDPVLTLPLRHRKDSTHGIININKVAHNGTVPVHHDLFLTQCLVSKGHNRSEHAVWTLVRSVRIGETDHTVIKSVQIMIQIQKLLDRNLLNAVGADRICRCILVERTLLLLAVHGSAG